MKTMLPNNESKLLKFALRSILALMVLLVLVFLLISLSVIWVSPKHYSVKQTLNLNTPIMDMKSYEQIWKTHRRPYIYSIKHKDGGEVHILGVEHVTDKNHTQFDSVRKIWEQNRPTVALVEGRLGFLFTWFQDPIKKYGEGGLVSALAKKDKTKLFTWEPTRDDEIKMLLSKHPADKLAMFYAFRPYFSNMRHGKPENPEKQLQEYLKSRTDYDGIRGIYTSWKQLDSIWKKDFPKIEWRDYSEAVGWPEGYLHDIWNDSNLTRDEHLVQIIIELVKQKEVVFVTMGASHAPRIEKALQDML